MMDNKIETEPTKETKKPEASVKWTASEFIDHQKNILWYLALLSGVILLSSFIFITTKDIVSVIAIGVVGVLFAFLAGKKPRVLSYEVNSKGLVISKKFYPWAIFKSFSVFEEGAIGTINFMPLKRFMPEVSVHFPPDEAGQILDFLTLHLPNEEYHEKTVDRFAKKIRF